MQPGASTTPHYHPKTEDIYYILDGTGRMTIDGQTRDVGPGDAVAIPPGAAHGSGAVTPARRTGSAGRRGAASVSADIGLLIETIGRCVREGSAVRLTAG